MCYGNPEIREKLAAIFLKRTGRDFQQKEMWNKKLFGIEIQMPVEELIYTYFDIEHLFGIHIPEKSLLDGDFDTFEHICNIVNDAVCRLRGEA